MTPPALSACALEQAPRHRDEIGIPSFTVRLMVVPRFQLSNGSDGPLDLFPKTNGYS